MKASYQRLETCAVLENVGVKLPGGNTYVAPIANICYHNSKAYVQLFIPGVVKIVSIPCQFGQTQFTEQQVRELLLGGFVQVVIKSGVCDVYFDIELSYEQQCDVYTGGITFGRHRKG